MRKFFFSAIAASFVFALCLSADETPRPIAAPAGAPKTVAELFERLHPMVRSQSIGRPNVITSDGHAAAFLIPISGNLQGAGGTFFKSDLFVGNYNSTDQRIGISYLQANVPNSGNPIAFFSVPANGATVFLDVVGQTLGKSGLGAIVVAGVDSFGNPDSSADIDGFSRIWTPQPGSSGTVSQNFEAISVNDSLGSFEASILGLRQNTAFRSNIGIVNLDTQQHTWTIRAVTGASQQITVPAYSVVQTGLVAGSGSSQSGSVLLTLNSDGFGFWWSAYGTSNDNVTGDGWVSRAKQ